MPGGSDGMAKVPVCASRPSRRAPGLRLALIIAHDQFARSSDLLLAESSAHSAPLPSFFGDPFTPPTSAVPDRLVCLVEEARSMPEKENVLFQHVIRFLFTA